VVKTWQEVKDDLLIHRMSPTYTTWIHHGEEGGGTDIIESSDVHGSHHDGWMVEEEEQEDCDDNILSNFHDLVQNLLTSEEQAGRVPKFKRVLDELKQLVSSRSTFSRFSFLVRLLYIKSHYRVSNNYFDALLALLLDAFPSSNVSKSFEEHANIFDNWDKVMKVSMCARTTMCCFGVIMRNCKRAVTSDFKGQNQMQSICMPGSIFIHIVTSSVNIKTLFIT
jgi:hypothetical protein